MAYQYPNNTYNNGAYNYSQQQKYPGAEQQVTPPIIMPQENQQGSYTEPYSQYPPPPQFPSPNNNSYSPPAEPPYNNNLYNPPVEPTYNYNSPAEPTYNNNLYNPQGEPSYNNNNNTYNAPYEQNNSYNPIPEPSYSNPPYPEQYPSEPYTSSPNPPQPYNNNFYSDASPYITQPYSSTQNYNNTQSPSPPPPAPAPAPSSVPASFSALSSSPPVPSKSTYDNSPKPPKNYEPPNVPSKNYSSPYSEAPPSSSYSPSSMIPPNQRPEPPNNHREKKKRNRPRRCGCDCADCFSICGCIRCTCNVITFIIAALLIAGGIVCIIYSRILPGKCQGLCDPTNGGGIPNPGGNLPSNNNPIDQANKEFKNGTQSCSNLCSESVFNILFYGGIGLAGLGAVMVITQLLCMCCRVGSSGGKGSGCCYCC